MKSRMVEPLNIEESAEGGGILLTVSGRITIDSSPALRDRLLAILQQQSLSTLTIDLTAAPYLDTSGLATLVEALKIARANRTALKIRLHERPRYLMEVTGLLPFFEAAGQAKTDTGSKDN